LEGTTSATQARVRNAYGKLSLSFEANQGQTDDQVQFLARSQGMSLFLTATETVLVLPSRPLPGRVPLSASPPTAPTVLRMHFVGSNPVPQVAGPEQLPGTSNYFLGNDPTQWRTHIPTFAKVTYREMYPGSAVLYYGTPHQLEYDLLVAPGADPSTITLAIAQEGGAEPSRPLPLHLDADWALVLPTPGGAMTGASGSPWTGWAMPM